MDDKYQHRRHNKNLLMAHIILVTKYRRKLFLGAFRDDTKQYLYETCVKHHWYIKRMESDKDHVHILHYKTLLRKNYWKEHTLWSDGYFAASVGTVSQTVIEHYIETQG